MKVLTEEERIKLCEEIASKVCEYVLERVPEYQLFSLDVRVDITREYPYEVTIEVSIETSPFYRGSLNKLIDEAIEYGLKVADELLERYRRDSGNEEGGSSESSC